MPGVIEWPASSTTVSSARGHARWSVQAFPSRGLEVEAAVHDRAREAREHVRPEQLTVFEPRVRLDVVRDEPGECVREIRLEIPVAQPLARWPVRRRRLPPDPLLRRAAADFRVAIVEERVVSGGDVGGVAHVGREPFPLVWEEEGDSAPEQPVELAVATRRDAEHDERAHALRVLFGVGERERGPP